MVEIAEAIAVAAAHPAAGCGRARVPAALRRLIQRRNLKIALPGKRRFRTEHVLRLDQQALAHEHGRPDAVGRQIAFGGHWREEFVIAMTVLGECLPNVPQVVLTGNHTGLESAAIHGRQDEQPSDEKDRAGQLPTSTQSQCGRSGRPGRGAPRRHRPAAGTCSPPAAPTGSNTIAVCGPLRPARPGRTGDLPLRAAATPRPGLPPPACIRGSTGSTSNAGANLLHFGLVQSARQIVRDLLSNAVRHNCPISRFETLPRIASGRQHLAQLLDRAVEPALHRSQRHAQRHVRNLAIFQAPGSVPEKPLPASSVPANRPPRGGSCQPAPEHCFSSTGPAHARYRPTRQSCCSPHHPSPSSAGQGWSSGGGHGAAGSRWPGSWRPRRAKGGTSASARTGRT